MKTIAMLVAVLGMAGCTAQTAGPPEPGASEPAAVTGDAGDMPCPDGEHACPFGPQGWTCYAGYYYCALDSVTCIPPATSCTPWNGLKGDASNLAD